MFDIEIPAPDGARSLGRMMRRLVAAGVRLTGQYSDHDNRKVLVVDDADAARTALTWPIPSR